MSLRDNFKYSPAEMRVIEFYGFLDICGRISPPRLYELLALKAFESRDSSPYADALRTSLEMFQSGAAYRMSLEWDRQITAVLDGVREKEPNAKTTP